ncbi:MAG TPA: DUF4157 domain-containing protein, partial [Arcobacter sp.]|nr:DUF4157 domain-containing protein [Arcobacter sp.]
STGLPDNLKNGIESLSGYSMDDVNVHYNSSKPTQLNAHAFAQGSDIHVASGQEKHLAHEAWHVVQQKQGRVQPTRQMKGKVNINDDVGLEREADMMGEKALQGKFESTTLSKSPISLKTVQLKDKVVQLWDVHGRMWIHDTGRENLTNNEENDNSFSILFKFNMPNYSVSEWKTALREGDSNFSESLFGFLLFSKRPNLVGCSATEMANFLEPYFNQGRTHRAEIVSELEGRENPLIATLLGANISTERIENYWNHASAPSDSQKLNFVTAIMSNSDDMSLPDYTFVERVLLSGKSDYIELFNNQFAHSAIGTLVSQYYARALVRISVDGNLRSVSRKGTKFLAEYGNNNMRSRMMAESGAMTMKALDVLVSNTGGDSNAASFRNNAYTVITNAGNSMQSILQAQLSADAEAIGVVDAVFDQVWSLLPGGGTIGDLVKGQLKTALTNSLHSMVRGENMQEKIQIFRNDFQREVRNIVEVTSLTPEQGTGAINALNSASGAI